LYHCYVFNYFSCKDTKKREKNKRIYSFFFRVLSIFAIFMAKIRKILLTFYSQQEVFFAKKS